MSSAARPVDRSGWGALILGEVIRKADLVSLRPGDVFYPTAQKGVIARKETIHVANVVANLCMDHGTLFAVFRLSLQRKAPRLHGREMAFYQGYGSLQMLPDTLIRAEGAYVRRHVRADQTCGDGHRVLVDFFQPIVPGENSDDN